MRGTVICTICATLQAGRRHKWLSYGHRIGCAMMMLAGLGHPARMRSMLSLTPNLVEETSLLKNSFESVPDPRSDTRHADFGLF
jgi:hypothetical protein